MTKDKLATAAFESPEPAAPALRLAFFCLDEQAYISSGVQQSARFEWPTAAPSAFDAPKVVQQSGGQGLQEDCAADSFTAKTALNNRSINRFFMVEQNFVVSKKLTLQR